MNGEEDTHMNMQWQMLQHHNPGLFDVKETDCMQ